jgi:hypothetical protein
MFRRDPICAQPDPFGSALICPSNLLRSNLRFRQRNLAGAVGWAEHVNMRVMEVHFPEEPTLGLKSIAMKKLGPLVLLAGKNGSGKTRLLNRLSAWPHEQVHPFGPRHTIENFLSVNVAPPLQLKTPPEGRWWRNAEVQAFVEKTWKTPASLWAQFPDIVFDSPGTPRFVSFVPKRIDLRDPAQLHSAGLAEGSSNVEQIGVQNLEQNALVWIQVIQNRWWSATHQLSTVSESDRRRATKRYEALCGLIERFLGTKLTRSLDDQAQIFGFPLGQAHLSDGQTILLQFCVAIHAQADQLSDLIVLMDEPENHLHPGAVVDALTEITGSLTNGQLWIATHSVPLLAQFDPDSIWWMEDGAVAHAGSTPEKVLHGLVGDDDRMQKLTDFLGLPSVLAANNLAYQCLLPPRVLSTPVGDPQTTQIQTLLEQYRKGEKLRILDFGAGRGRLVSALTEGSVPVKDVSSHIDYFAFDRSAEHQVECEAAIGRLYDDSKPRYYSSESDIRAVLADHSVDVVVMCNVLHEIDPIDWLQLFSPNGLIRHLLRDDGFLLLVEDMEMRIGERAHQRGFLVLDTADLRTLFRIPEAETGFAVNDARGDGRLKAHTLPAQCLGGITGDTLHKTLEQVRVLAMEGVRTLRNKPPTYQNGRKHAFYVQQLANADLALSNVVG